MASPLRALPLIVLLVGVAAAASGQRLTRDGRYVSSDFCAPNAVGVCQWTDYAWAVVLPAVPIFLVGVIVFILSYAFVWTKCCCGWWGGRGTRPTYGYLCPARTPKKAPYYSRWTIYGLKAALGVFSIILIVSLIVAMADSGKASTSIDEFATTVNSTNDILRARLTRIQEVLASVNTSGVGVAVNMTNLLDQQSVELVKVQNETVKVSNQVIMYNDYRAIATYAVMAPTLVIVLCAIVAMLFNLRRVTWGLVYILIMATLLVWAVFGIHVIANTASRDVCYTLSSLLDTGFSGITARYSNEYFFQAVLACARDDNPYQYLQQPIDEAIAQAIQVGCAAFEQTCSMPAVTCDASARANCTRSADDFQSFVENTKLLEPLWFCSSTGNTTLSCILQPGENCQCPQWPRLCPDETPNDGKNLNLLCNVVQHTVKSASENATDPSIRALTQTVVKSADLLVQLNDLYYEDVRPLLDCSFMETTATSLRQTSCSGLWRHVLHVAQSSGVAACTLVFLIVTMFLGGKRFRNPHADDEHLYTVWGRPHNGSSDAQSPALQPLSDPLDYPVRRGGVRDRTVSV